MAVCFEEKCIESLAKAVLFIDDDSSVSPADCADVASEVCNQICGKSKILLQKSGFSFEIERPEVFTGTADELMNTLTSPKIALVFHYAKGLPFYVCFWG